MTASDDSTALAASIATDTQAIVARIATLRADIDVLYNLAQGVAMAVLAAQPVPAPSPLPSGTLGASVAVGPAPEAV
ncbi:hypothetical protein DFR70_104467 [Nocardia tenerifensis]|uniref:Uncharacterized protein n=1 Tax=Nocardia tenerifensis TaxID=228006 RepID=A0A318KFQ9_9NOCA|nr:hypothetical protein [Nocardia tenerifensis]PXX65403.1 hypothetical protein DFR70_104467 [Nocardia tenerifensis]